MVDLERNGSKADISGFKFKAKAEPFLTISENRNLDYTNIRNIRSTEPRIEYIADLIQCILQIIDLVDSQNKIVKIDGFRLKDLKQWLVECNDPLESIESYLAGGRCNASCIFCYERGSPPEMKGISTKQISKSELDTRLKYFDPHSRKALFRVYHQFYEAFGHPNAIEVLSNLRKVTNRAFHLITNGFMLTENLIKELVLLKPLSLIVSLNSADLQIRKRLMADLNPQVAFNSLKLLKENDIPFIIHIVPWPSVTTMDDLEKTLYFCDANNAEYAAILLPGYTKYFKPPPKNINEQYFKDVIKVAKQVRKNIEMPIVIRPSIYEDLWDNKPLLQPKIIGVIKGSSAYMTGLRTDDIIKNINGIKIETNSQAYSIFRLLSMRKIKSLDIQYERNGRTSNILLNVDRKLKGLGILINDNIRSGSFDEMIQIIKENSAKRVLLLSSYLMQHVVAEYFRKYKFEDEINVKIFVEAPKNSFFGGNIITGDLLVVQDFIECIRNFIKKNGLVDLIFLPSSPFSLWKRDLIGIPFTAIEHEFKIKVYLISCQRIM